MPVKEKVLITVDRTGAYTKLKVETFKHDVATLNLEVDVKDLQIVEVPKVAQNMGRRKSLIQKRRISITLDVDVAELVDATRGRLPRSAFINDRLATSLKPSP